MKGENTGIVGIVEVNRQKFYVSGRNFEKIHMYILNRSLLNCL